MSDIISKLHDRIMDECTEVDPHVLYDEDLDEVYSFESVGGIFAHMQPSKVLEEMDPVAYRCGFNDWLDGMDLADIGVGTEAYYRISDMEEVRDNMVSELEDELSALEGDLDDYADQRADLESDEDEAIGRIEMNVEVTERQISELQERIHNLQKHVF